ncbi:MAG: PTS transporter subunit EIIC [Symbiobacterium sp.]|uniref:PTS transporter subunit EIIC n=1 Tax=Symbiobacterium sp. TaxID=1971213 RepID=UPI0034649357
MTNEQLAARIIELLGGKENILTMENCMTRIRTNIQDPAKVDLAGLKATKGVLGVVADEPTYIQVVLGPGKVREIMEICTRQMGIREQKPGQGQAPGQRIGDWQANKAAVKSRQKHTELIKQVRVLADIFTPMIPAFIASGICNGLGKLLKIMMDNGTLPDGMVMLVIYNVIVLIGNAFLSYLAIFTGVRSAKQFGVNEMLGGMIGAASLNSVVDTISKTLGWYNADVVNNSILATGAGGIIGVVLGVWILAQIDKWVHKWMPEVLDVSFSPVISMLIAMPAFVLVVMPITGWISNGLSAFLNLFLNSTNPIVSAITGYVLAATFLPLVLLGLHRGLIPFYTLQLESLGGITLFPAVAMAGAGQVGAAIALYIKAKRVHNDRLNQVIAGALPAGILGIGEPLIYGVTLPMMKPFITAGLGAGFGGAYVMLKGVMSTAFSPSGILAATHVMPEHVLNYVIGILISYAAGAVITYFAIPDEDVASV